jgi:hypothetical protein
MGRHTVPDGRALIEAPPPAPAGDDAAPQQGSRGELGVGELIVDGPVPSLRRGFRGTAGVGELTVDGPVPTLGGRAMAACRQLKGWQATIGAQLPEVEMRLRALGVDPDAIAPEPHQAPPLSLEAQLTVLLQEPGVVELSRADQRAVASHRLGRPISKRQVQQACQTIGQVRKPGRRRCRS